MPGTGDHGAAVRRHADPVRTEVRHLPHDPAPGDCPGAHEEAAVDKNLDAGETDAGRDGGPGARDFGER
ncbi:hypothetical protein ACWDNT_05995 [Streptomyces sp. NPDC000963]